MLITAACLLKGKAYVWLMNLTGVFGAVVLLFPGLYRAFATTLLYEQPGRVEWNDRFTAGVRFIGVLYIFMAIRAFNERHANN